MLVDFSPSAVEPIAMLAVAPTAGCSTPVIDRASGAAYHEHTAWMPTSR